MALSFSYIKPRINYLLIIAGVILAATAGILYYAHSSKTQASGNFIPGNIISDAKMGDMNAMNESQIRTFINQRNANCASNNNLCFRNYREEGKDAARIIFEASREQRINPQVILVTIQKEQGLITRTNPAQWMYNSAMGYACPDSTPGRCGSEQQGFLRQVTWGATMYRAILDGGGTWSNRYASGTRWFTPYNLGLNTIQWSPNKSCGSSSVNIENRATQALYNYTPYRPNSAALNAGYGTGNDCSVYGNRNFYLYMRDWFGYLAAPNAYTWSMEGRSIFYDSNYTERLPTAATLNRGQSAYVEFKARNTGGITWTKSNTFLGTERAKDRTSAFRHSSWISNNRAAQLIEDQVAPGNVGTFRFRIVAPQTMRAYSEHFNIVLEGVTWLHDNGARLAIDVVNARQIQMYLDSARTISLPSNQGYLGQTIYARLTVTNNTSKTLPANTAIATTSPADRPSQLRHTSWISNNRITRIGKEVAPGESAVATFALQSPATAGTISERFGLVVDGVGWIDQDSITLTYANVERPSDRLQRGQTLTRGQYLLSSNSQYRLVLQTDGNLVLYSPTRAIWASNTVGSGGNRLVAQTDGNLVLYSSSRAVWASDTDKTSSNRLSAQTDGNLVLYSSSRAVWASDTDGKR